MRSRSVRGSEIVSSPLGWVLAAAISLVLATSMACGVFPSAKAQAKPAGKSEKGKSATPDSTQLAKAEGEWPLPGRDPEGTRFSPLAQINIQNAKDLRVAWTFSTGVLHGHEGQPLVVGSTMYLVTPFPNIVYALDLANPTGPAKWVYKPNPDPASQGEACCDIVNRGASYSDGKIVFNRLDNITVALDAETGRVVWQTRLGDINRGETMTMAPLIVNGRVFVGNSGGEMGVRGWITALDLKDGKVLWRAYNSGPDTDVLIGRRFRPFYHLLQGTDLGVSTWPSDEWKRGGGAVWGWITYDPQVDLIFYGSGNPGVWNPDMRPGDNLWSTALFARDPKTGEAVWAYQTTPHDQWDYDGINEVLPLNMTIDGQPRRVVVQVGRTGFVYVIDRNTGEVLSATPFTHVTWAKSVDVKTGRPIEDSAFKTHQGVNVTGICPAATGGKDQQPAAYSPHTGWLYSPATNLCMDYKAGEVGYIAGTPYVGAEVMMYPGPGGNRGEFMAWDVAGKRKVWSIPERFPVWTGALVTGGDVAFYGTMDGWVKAVNAKSGEILWKFKTGSGLIGNFISFLGPDGKQYVAVYAGVGGWAGAIAFGLSPEDPTAALGFVNAMKDLPQYTGPGGMLYVFALP